MKRQRGRNRNKNNNHNHNNHNRSLDSNGPDVKVRGTASTIYEKYTTLARDAKTSGNRVKAENYRQHAEHYLRLVNIQEAAKAAAQAAREEAEAARQAARAEAGEDDDAETKPRRNGRNRHRRNDPQAEKEQSEKGQSERGQSEKVQAPKALDVIEPEHAADTPQTDMDASPAEEAPKRRRKAPARKKASPPADSTDQSSGQSSDQESGENSDDSEVTEAAE